VSRLLAAEDLIDATAVASALGLAHRNSVATYLRRYDDFPRPVIETSGGRCRLWSRSDVDSWIAMRRLAGKAKPA
jgi:glutathione-regulated potassium-efflux system ancillary protein KefG